MDLTANNIYAIMPASTRSQPGAELNIAMKLATTIAAKAYQIRRQSENAAVDAMRKLIIFHPLETATRSNEGNRTQGASPKEPGPSKPHTTGCQAARRKRPTRRGQQAELWV